ncbi:hypothetical protein MON38_14040 [Hymenobacter sp. DH14]|uniref:Outer membrane protein beta-barrel domain-containing protein n=1 Tax=Hymenobacter cyanobacteriorum TaxID=2926463 RepID=A0A9X1VLX6_9BACT|nr:hypothetical protein [Hymenobacter cyanobacteriorum]MCI1188546.1 hypothetical protein [Hymenobacter cyanobacteriorum]
MSANPIENNATPKTTGSLEELFRHHLGEEAAVPPRPMLWDQIDNSLLIRQNEQYRRRLVATRWVAAASLMLATLAGTGWWASRTGLVGTPEMATVTGPAANGAQSNQGASRGGFGPAGTAGSTSPAAATTGAVASAAGTAQQAAADYLNGSSQRGTTGRGGSGRSVASATGLASTRRATTYSRGLNNTGEAVSATYSRLGRQGVMGRNAAAAAGSEVATSASATANETAAMSAGSVAMQNAQLPASSADGLTNSNAASGAVALGSTTTAAGTTLATGGAGTVATSAPAAASVSAASLSASVAAAPATALGAEEAGLLASRSVALGAVETPAPALPGALAAGPEPTELALGTHRWQYGASYTASAFNPNINFSRAGIEPDFGYNPVLGPAELSEQAATEYRQNLRAGLAQRLALTVARRLNGHWSVGSGVEFTKANARSSSTVAFVGEQIADGGQIVGSGQRRTTDFSYTMAGLPLELRYSNPAKHGWSLYGRLGGVVSALLGNRSEVAGRPEVTQTYSITSASTPYRRLTSSVRGAAGARFSPGAGRWAFSMGPVAELGLVSLNAHPVQSYFAQSHPYSVGLEAGVEFGR